MSPAVSGVGDMLAVVATSTTSRVAVRKLYIARAHLALARADLKIARDGEDSVLVLIRFPLQSFQEKVRKQSMLFLRIPIANLISSGCGEKNGVLLRN